MEKKIWIQSISWVDTSGWKWEPSVHDHICRFHFVSGRPSKDENAIDYVPTIFRDVQKRSNALTSNPPRQERAARGQKVQLKKKQKKRLDGPFTEH